MTGPVPIGKVRNLPFNSYSVLSTIFAFERSSKHDNLLVCLMYFKCLLIVQLKIKRSRKIVAIINDLFIICTSQQPDLEALLSGNPETFIKSVVPWMGLHR